MKRTAIAVLATMVLSFSQAYACGNGGCNQQPQSAPGPTADQQQGQNQQMGQAQQSEANAIGVGQGGSAFSGSDADAAAKAVSDASSKSTSGASANTNLGVGVTTGVGVSNDIKSGDSSSSSHAMAGDSTSSSRSGDSKSSATTGPVNVETGDSKTSSEAKTGDQTTNVNPTLTSNVSGTGTGGAGGNASTGSVDAGNNNGATVSTVNNTRNSTKFLYVNLPTVPAAAPTVTGTGGIAVTSACGSLMEKVQKPIEYLILGHFGSRRVTLDGQNSDTLVPVLDKDGKPAFDVVDNGDGTVTVWGSIYTEAAIIVSSSVSKSFGLGVFGSNGGGNAANGVASTITGTQRIIALGRCEYRKYKVVPVEPPTLGLEAPKTEVLAPTGHSVLVKDTPPKLCNGKPIPEGYKCAFIRDKVNVVKDANLTKK